MKGVLKDADWMASSISPAVQGSISKNGSKSLRGNQSPWTARTSYSGAARTSILTPSCPHTATN